LVKERRIYREVNEGDSHSTGVRGRKHSLLERHGEKVSGCDTSEKVRRRKGGERAYLAEVRIQETITLY